MKFNAKLLLQFAVSGIIGGIAWDMFKTHILKKGQQ